MKVGVRRVKRWVSSNVPHTVHMDVVPPVSTVRPHGGAAVECFRCTKNDAGRRVDRVLRILLPACPRVGVYAALRRTAIRLNGRPVQPAKRVQVGDVLSLPESLCRARAASSRLSKMPGTPKLRVLPSVVFKTQDLLFFHKPAGLCVHGPRSLDAWVRGQGRAHVPPALSFRPGPLHRLDRGTEGLIAFSRSLRGAQWFSAALQQHTLRKFYLAITAAPARTSAAARTLVRPGEVTHVQTVLHSCDSALVLRVIVPVTGKKHQIRRYCAAQGFPLVGDRTYGGASQHGNARYTRFFLLAWCVRFPSSRLQALPAQVWTTPSPAFMRVLTSFPPDSLARARACVDALDGALGTDATCPQDTAVCTPEG